MSGGEGNEEEKGKVRLTKGVKYCQLFASSPPLPSSSSSFTLALSLNTNAISMILAAPAAINVYPNTVCTCVLSFKLCGCALIAHPVIKITIAGTKFLFGLPSLFLLNHIPNKPAHHHTMPILVCWRSFFPQGWPQRCSVKVLTQPQAAMRRESKNSCERPVRLDQAWPTRRRMVRMMP